jgi:hypothetical protein
MSDASQAAINTYFVGEPEYEGRITPSEAGVILDQIGNNPDEALAYVPAPPHTDPGEHARAVVEALRGVANR